MSELKRPTGIITSPQHPLPYGPNTNCSWKVWVDPECDFVLTILALDLGCNAQGDDAEVSGSDGTNSFPITTLCTLGREGAFVIRGISAVLINFTSRLNSTEPNDGFMLRYEQIPVAP